MIKSYIYPKQANRLNTFLYLLRKPYLFIDSINFKDMVTKNNWVTSNLKTHSASLENNADGLNIELKKSDLPFYIILNAKVKDFKEINISNGISTSSFSALNLAVFVHKKKYELKCTLLVIEYDINLQRINTKRLERNTLNLYTPSSDTKRIVIVLELTGKGSTTINGLVIEESKSDNLNNLEKTKAINSLESYFSVIEKCKADANKEVYKWKRRALKWEEKSKKIESSGQDKGEHLSSNVRESNNKVLPSLGYDLLIKLAKTFPKSNGVDYYKKLPYSVGIISDIYMFNFYKDTFNNCFYLSPDNYKSILINNHLDAIIYVSCWKGINNEEWRGVKFREKPENALNNILKLSQKNNIKLIFQTIEDPSNFEYFLPIAEKFDYIFTSDIDMIENYKKHLKHNNVFYGEYGFNPLLNNPIGSQRDLINASFFAGSYTKRYEERSADMEIMFDSIINSNGSLVIADRNIYSKDENLTYPKKYQAHLIPPLEHELLQNIHKIFRFNLNFNSIKNSPSMCAMRIYELQAQGTNLISNYAKSVFNTFPNIRIIPALEDLSYDLDYHDKLGEYKHKMDSLRLVMTNKTSYDVVGFMFNNIGLTNKIDLPSIAVIHKENLDFVQSSFRIQKYNNKILIDIKEISTEDKWNKFQKIYNIKYFTWFSSQNNYEENYLQDMINGFKYTNVNYITKNSFFTAEELISNSNDHEYTDFILGKDKTLFRSDIYSPLEFKDIINSLEKTQLRGGYTIDPFEMNYQKFITNKLSSIPQREYELSVIVPVFNNGKFLINTCIPSLKRNKLWDKMEILLIDDGSTDIQTISNCKMLKDTHTNIKTFYYKTGGSGSASRPRNKGIDLASSELITFLDPDNEISPNGYDVLISLYHEESQKKTQVDFISGYNVKVDKNVTTIAKHTDKRLSIINNFKNGYFNKGRFPTIATQAIVISKKIFTKHPTLRFIENAAGQDTLFGWELLLNSTNGGFTADAFIIYYADREDSVTNIVDKFYFQKKLILEKGQIKVLKKHNLLDIYKEKHFDNFMYNWYLEKLKYVQKETYKESCILLSEICKLYNKDIKNYIKEEQ